MDWTHNQLVVSQLSPVHAVKFSTYSSESLQSSLLMA